MDVLIVDDEPTIRQWMAATLKPLGLNPVAVESGEEALRVLEERDIGFVITDLMMPRMDGAALLQEIRNRQWVLPVVVMSGVGSADDAVNLLKLGADDFLSKPMRREPLLARLEQIIQKARIYEEARLFRRFVEAEDEQADGAIVTRSPAMLKVLRRLPAVSRTDASVLVLGPSGSGKELVARAVHRLSKRSDKPFVAVNCGALPETLVESTLFGHRKGSFTGADRDQLGLARAADGGTLFLDEVGDLPMSAQVKLLRFLQSKEVTPVGETKAVKVDVRIVAATHRDLPKRIAGGQFREDLYYRLNVIGVDVPSLDERPEDVPVLANHFLARFSPQYGSVAKAFSPAALESLVARKWSGNVRELENVVQRALVAADGPIVDVHHLQPAQGGAAIGATRAAPVASGRPNDDLRPFQVAKKAAIDAFERTYLDTLLARTGRMTHAAQLAGIDRKGLWRLLKKHGLRKGGEGDEDEGGDDDGEVRDTGT